MASKKSGLLDKFLSLLGVGGMFDEVRRMTKRQVKCYVSSCSDDTAAHVPSLEFRHDNLLGINDLERLDGGHW